MRTLPPEVIAELAPKFGAPPHGLGFLGGGQEWSDGTLYAHPAPGGDRVIKFLCFPHSDLGALERAEDRIRFVRSFGEHGCRIVMPEPSLQGALFETCERDGFVWLAYAYRKVPGRSVERGDPSVASGAYFRAVGALLGGLHAAWEARAEALLPDGSCPASAAIKGWRDEWAGFRSWCRDDEVGRAWERLRSRLEGLPVERSGYGFVHNDAHVWNLLFDPQTQAARSGGEPELTVIDFDVAHFHWFMCDVAVAVYSFLIMATGKWESPERPPEGFRERMLDPFWEGYRRHREPGPAWIDRLDLFLQYRRILMFTVFQGETEKKPEWRARWRSRILAEDARLGDPSQTWTRS